MNVTFLYFAQVRAAAGTDAEKIDLPDGADLKAAMSAAVEIHGEALGALVIDGDGAIQASLLVLVNGLPADRSGSAALKDGDQISLLSAVAGG